MSISRTWRRMMWCCASMSQPATVICVDCVTAHPALVNAVTVTSFSPELLNVVLKVFP
jgi:hypothetical protein